MVTTETLQESIETWRLLSNKKLDDLLWESFRKKVFPCKRINLNPGTLGTPSIYVEEAFGQFWENDLKAFPLGIYQSGRNSIRAARERAKRIWNFEHHEMAISFSGSSCLNLLCLEILLKFHREKRKAPFRVLTTLHEHIGGIGFFLNHPDCTVKFLKERDDKGRNDLSFFESTIERFQPDIFVASAYEYDLACFNPIQKWSEMIQNKIPSCIFILDIAQSIGISSIDLFEVDFALGSTHKWLFGPPGLGLLWLRKDRLEWLKAISWNGEWIDQQAPLSKFEITGGHYFPMYKALEKSLLLYSAIGQKTILERSNFLCAYFATELYTFFKNKNIKVEFYGLKGNLDAQEINNPESYCGYFSVDIKGIDSYPVYMYLNENKAHIKCIKKNELNLLRFGFPYYESIPRLKSILNLIRNFFES